jgi:nitroreductase
LGLPSELEPVALVPIGYPAVEADVTRHDGKRRKLEELVHRDGFRK